MHLQLGPLFSAFTAFKDRQKPGTRRVLPTCYLGFTASNSFFLTTEQMVNTVLAFQGMQSHRHSKSPCMYLEGSRRALVVFPERRA